MSKKQTSRVSAYGIIEENKKLLLCRLSKIVEGHAGSWTLPGGGLEFGEEPHKAVAREVKEETGLILHQNPKLLDVNSVVLEFEEHLSHALRIIYSAKVRPGKIVVETDGTTDAADWFSLEEAKNLTMTSLGKHGVCLWQRKNMTPHELFMEAVKERSEEERVESLKDLNILDAAGKLTSQFGG